MRLPLVVACLLAVVAGASRACRGEEKPQPELRTVETYVPYDEFLKIVGQEKDATVMSLEEYRTLVQLAIARGAARKDQPLPAVKCSLAEAVYTGVAQDTTVRFDVAFKLALAGDEWVRCDLGPAMPGMGQITLDGAPGWVVVDKGRAWLLVKGAGAHAGTLSFSLAPRKEEDVQSIAGPLLNAATAVLRLEVSGRAAALEQPLPLDTVYDDVKSVTRFSLALGRSGKLALSWRRKHDAQKNEVLLLAQHRVSYLLERASPTFRISSRITVSRRKTDELFLVEPPGGRIVRLTGPDVHSWNRVGDSLRVLLERPVMGDVEIQAEGLLSAAPGSYELGGPAVKDAREDTRYIALFEAAESRIEVARLTGMRELALNEIGMPQMPRGKLARVYLAEQRDARVVVNIGGMPPIFDTQAVLTATIDDREVLLRAVMAVQPEQGRVYTLVLRVPPPWTLDPAELRERDTKRGISAEMYKDGDVEAWVLALTDAADATHRLEFSALFKLRDPAWSETEWEKRALNFGTPALFGARRGLVYLGISVHPAIDIGFGEMPAWRTETAGKLEQLGVNESRLRAGLVSETPGSDVRMELTRKTPRGDYDLVTHVLTQEREVWVRADVRLGIVDRAVDELALSLPPEAKDPLYVNGAGIKEVVAGASPGQRRVRFNQAWQGVRMLRVEYRAPLVPDTEVPVPDIRIEVPLPGARVAGKLDSRRRIVFQSAGVVELKVTPGAGLRTASLEDTPEFARPFRTGRALLAFTFAPDGQPGTYSVHVLERSPTLSSVAGEVELSTVLDASGVARTHAVFPRLYAREQYMSVKLPPNAKLILLRVDDQDIRPVRGATPDVIAVPLPPRSSARVEMIYEHMSGPWGSFGSWEEVAPDPIGIPVGLTNWRICYPSDQAVSVRGGNVGTEGAAPPEFFAVSFWSNLLQGRWPRWTAWETPALPARVGLGSESESGRRSVQQQGQAQQQSQQLVAQEVAARDANATQAKISALAIPEGAVVTADKLGGGAHIVLAHRSLAYSRFASRTVFFLAVVIGLWLAMKRSPRALAWYVILGLVCGTVVPPALNWQSPLLAVPFCEGLSLLGLGLLAMVAVRGLKRFWWRARGERALTAGAAAAALLLLSVAGSACAGESESVIVPYPKETLPVNDMPPRQTKVYVPKTIFLDLMSRAHPEKQAVQEMPNMEDRRNLALASAGATASGGANPERLIDGKVDAYAAALWQKGQQFVITLPKSEKVDMIRVLLWQSAERFSRYRLEVSTDGTTYATVADRTQGCYSGWQTDTFARQDVKSVRLTGTFDSGGDGAFNVAEIEVLAPPTPIRAAIGNAQYELTAAEKTYRCKGTLDVATFDPKGWVTVPLDFGSSQLVSLLVDGQPASIAQDKGVPFIQLQGAGKHKLEVELEGPLTLSPGRAQFQARFVGGLATRVTVVLPPNVELDAKSLPAGAWVEKDAKGAQRCQVDLGGVGGEIALSWRSPDIRGKGTSQIAARSYSQLQLGPAGYGVFRVDRISIDGDGVDQLAYKVVGAWDIASVTAGDLAEWNVAGEGEERRLRLWFQKPINQALIQVTGWAPLGFDEAQMAVLVLENATRQEGFIGLQHGDGRRFTTRSLDGLKRASSQELATMFKLPAESLPDRIYRWHEPPVKNALSVEMEPGQAALDTQIVGVIKPDRLLACVRSRYTASGRTPLRHEVELPAGWDVRMCHSTAMRSWEIVESGGVKRLVIYFTARAATGTEVIWSAEQRFVLPPDKPLVLELPQPRAVADNKTTESMDWVLATDQSLALSQGAATTMQGLPLERAPAWVRLETTEAYQSAYRSLKPGSKLVVEITKRGSVVTATVVSVLRPADDHVLVNVRCRFQIAQAGRDRFALKLPAGAQLVSLAAKNLRGREVKEGADGVLVTALLESPVSGAQTIDLAYRLPRAAGQDVVVGPAVIEDKDVTQVEQYVGILQVERGLVMIADKKGLTKPLQTEELPFLPDRVSTAALVQVFVAEPVWSVTLRQPDVKVETGQPVEVSLAVIKTVIAADGGVRSIATYTVRNRATQFLRIAMPDDATLWGVLVDGQPVTVSHERQGARKVLLIPIQRLGLADLPIEIVLVYESARLDLPAAYRSYTPQAPQVLIDSRVVETYWQFFVPDEYEVKRASGGTMKDVAGSVLVGGKLKSNIEDVERLVKIADSADNPAQKRKALRNIVRRRQDLDDNATVLQNTGQNAAPDELKRIGRDDLQGQFAENTSMLRQATDLQRKLAPRQKEFDAAAAGSADTEQQQAFLDNYNFLGNDWRRGKRYAKTMAETPQPARGDVPVAALENVRRFAGYKKGELPPPPAARVTQYVDPLPVEGGLQEEAERQVKLEIGATDLRVPEKGKQITFRGVEVEPELTLTLRSVPSSWRFAAFGAMVVLLGALVFALRRARMTQPAA